ncbi:hypothetical protein [Bacillus sp. CECT 9360]|uniref:hypothetical protein n=1 Tax=Bacillus sp. CECT 9360 TaxID=2845821 RepID=UPI001E55E59F|nr:hypothetical protein [Bacillus sp. CECT 9360]CAH0343978.1 hypothetical protein BCI9360_00206 [Bacillus sp. CECT 9360]
MKLRAWILAGILFFVSQMAAITIQESYVLANILWAPFSAITNWSLPAETDPYYKFISLIRFDIILFVYAVLITSIVIVFKALFINKKSQPYEFEQELATALEAAYDDSLPTDTVRREVRHLFDQIKKQITNFVGVNENNVRAVMVYQTPGMASPMFSKMTWGSPITQEQKQLDDLAFKLLLQGGRSHTLWPDAKPQLPNGDAESYLLVRNVGDYRLGFLFAFKAKLSLSEEKLDKLKVEVAPITLLGHIDKILNVIVNYR